VRAAGIGHVPVNFDGRGGVTLAELDETAEQTGGAPRATRYRKLYERRATRGAGS
jgi:hypothetical protein